MALNRSVSICALVGLGTLFVFGCAKREAPEFASYAVIEPAIRIIPEPRPGVDGAIDQEMAFGTEVRTVAATARTYDLMKRYWSRLQREGLAEKIAAPYLDGQPYSAELGFSIFEKHVEIQDERLTALVHFGFSHRDPEVARAVADSMALEYLAFEKEFEAQQRNPYHSRLISHAFPAQN